MQRILLVEDNEMNRDLISRRLKRRGFDVRHAVDGAEGVEKATLDPPDLIIMDMGLPVLDGYEATRRLREESYVGPIIALTAHAMKGDRERCIEAGRNDFATKPISRRDLLQTVLRYLPSSAKR